MVNIQGSSREIEELVRQFRRYRRVIGMAAVAAAILLVVNSMFYSVDARSEGVLLRFGKHVATEAPGLHVKLPWPIDSVYKVPVELVRTVEFGFGVVEPGRRTVYASQTGDHRTEARMLTGDLNLCHVEWILQYRIKDPFFYLFHIGGHRMPRAAAEDLIHDVSEAVMRKLVGDRSVDEVIATGRDQIAADAKLLTQQLLDEYESGIEVVTVKLQSATPPEPVKDAFDNVNRARQLKERVINQARGERNRQVPAARGQRDRMIAEAEGYRERIVRTAQGQANAFLAKLTEYEKAPEVTRNRLYLEAMEDIISQVRDLVIIDSSIRGVLPILNLDTGSSILPTRSQGDKR